MRTPAAASDRTDGQQDRESPETWRREQQAARSLSVHKSEAEASGGASPIQVTSDISLCWCVCADPMAGLCYCIYSCQSLIILCSIITEPVIFHTFLNVLLSSFLPLIFAVQQQHHVSVPVSSWVKQAVKVLLRPFSPQCINAAVITEQSNVLHIYQEAIIKTQSGFVYSDTFIMSLY